MASFVQLMFNQPIPSGTLITGNFMETCNRSKAHEGLDIQWGGRGGGPMRGAEVVAPFRGIVVDVKDTQGLVLIWDPSSRRFVALRHMSDIPNTIKPVPIKDPKTGKVVGYECKEVNAGEMVGKVSDVDAYCVHLHFEVGFAEKMWKNPYPGPGWPPWDPTTWVPSSGFGSSNLTSVELRSVYDLAAVPSAVQSADDATTAGGGVCYYSSCCPPPPKPSGPQTSPQRRDPLVLNLDGNGIQTLGLDTGIHFDHDRNGFAELTGWIAPGNGVLMLDTNGNQVLDTGSDLFGDFMVMPNGMMAANGFQALAQYDSNGDGRIDARDPIWSRLKIWQYGESADGGYLGDPDTWGEINTLDELGIVAIGLDAVITSRTDVSGNTEVRSGHFMRSDGSTGSIAEYRFQRDMSNTIPIDFMEVPPDIAALPDLVAYGNVYDLQQAMVRDASGELKSLVEAFAAEASPANHSAIVERIRKVRRDGWPEIQAAVKDDAMSINGAYKLIREMELGEDEEKRRRKLSVRQVKVIKAVLSEENFLRLEAMGSDLCYLINLAVEKLISGALDNAHTEEPEREEAEA